MRLLSYQLCILLSVVSFGRAMEKVTKKSKDTELQFSGKCCQNQINAQQGKFSQCLVNLLVGKVQYCLFVSLEREVNSSLSDNVLKSIEGVMPSEQYTCIKDELNKIVQELLGDSLERDDTVFIKEMKTDNISLSLRLLIDCSFEKALEELIDKLVHVLWDAKYEVKSHPLFSVIGHDVQAMLGDSYQIDMDCLSEIIVMVVGDMNHMEDEVSYEQFLYAIVLEQIFHACDTCSERRPTIPKGLFSDSSFSYKYFSAFIDSSDVGSPEVGARFVSIIPELLSDRSHLKKQLSLELLGQLWDWTSYADSMRYYDGIYSVMSKETEEELVGALFLLAKAVKQKDGSLEDLLVQSVSYYGVTRSMRVLFKCGLSLSDNVMHNIVSKPLEWLDGEHYDNEFTMHEFNCGLSKTLRASVLFSSVYSKEPTKDEVESSKDRLIAIACSLKRLKVKLPRDVLALIYSKNLSLAQDLFNAFWVTHKQNHNIIYSLLFKRRLLTGTTLKSLMIRHKIERVQELLLVKNMDGKTPLECYQVEVDQWKILFEDTLDQVFSGLSLLDSEKVEENFSDEINGSVEEYYKTLFVMD